MQYLKVTLIDVGWGDSILLEASNGNSQPVFGLIDSNDNERDSYWPVWNFLRKKTGLSTTERKNARPYFDFIMLTHDHSDHGSGLQRLIKEYGTRRFWHPKVHEEDSPVLVYLRNYVDRYQTDTDREALDNSKIVGTFGDVHMDVLWPAPDWDYSGNPNNNSIVLSLMLGGRSIVLTGDAEGEVWEKIADKIPSNTVAFKVPHHGSRNGTIFHSNAPWVNRVAGFAIKPFLGISCHPNFPRKFDFPHTEVTNIFDENYLEYLRTDQHYHISFILTEHDFNVQYSHALYE